MTNSQKTTASNAKSIFIIGLLFLGFFHASEAIYITISLLGLHEYTSQTQFIPGVSLAYWGMLCLAMVCWIIPFVYEIWYQAAAPKPFSKPINFLFAAIFGGLLSVNLLGKIELIESTQFIPEFSFGLIGLMGFAGFSLLAPIIHQLKSKAPPLELILSALFGIVLSLIFLGKFEAAGHQQFISDFSIFGYTNILSILAFIFSIIFIVLKGFHKKYIYHYLRFLLLLMFGI